MILFVSGCVLVSFIILAVTKFLYDVWWNPIRIQSALRKQGIKGPPYRFFYGNAKDLMRMSEERSGSSMELSHQMFARIQPYYYLWTKLYGKNLINWLGPRPQLVITETQLAKEILNNNEMYPKPVFMSFMEKLFGDGLVTARGEKWARQRKLANHAFHGEMLKDMIPSMIMSVEIMLERWRQHENKEMDVSKEFKLLTSEVISRTAFGSSYLEGQNIFDMLMELTIILYRNGFKVRIPVLQKFIKTKDDIRSEELEQGMRDSILKMIKKREEEMKMGEVDSRGNDYLGVLIRANSDPDKTKKITIDDLVDECKTFYIAGQETTGSVLTWTVFLLAIHTDWQEKARQEVIQLFGQRTPAPEEISKLKIMSMILNETLRLYAPITNLIREVEKGNKFGKIIAPARMDILIPPLAVHHDPDIWGEDVHLFKPERFAQGVAKATKSNLAAFFPFGLGPRSCVGMNFATAEIKFALLMILQRYSFTLSPTYIHCPILLIGVNPKMGLQIILKPLDYQNY